MVAAAAGPAANRVTVTALTVARFRFMRPHLDGGTVDPLGVVLPGTGRTVVGQSPPPARRICKTLVMTSRHGGDGVPPDVIAGLRWSGMFPVSPWRDSRGWFRLRGAASPRAPVRAAPSPSGPGEGSGSRLPEGSLLTAHFRNRLRLLH
ncbi:hypothetical protein GCM10023079_28690 [Streptomyces chitinivorans]